ncbi:MAG TPA: C45 family autoproteolytic acyltransferase/hydrolase, partial [Thermoanaerobaculia bacterium]|nr:C45 family autoproteolytic acyltransferase/hydrolase [Thermoanaerobaculia bacterium]
DSLEVRHLVLTGTNEEIGRALAEIARDRYGARPEPPRDALRARAARRYIERNDPILYERMRGVAAAFDQRVDDDAFDYSGLSFTNLKAGCSIVHLPPQKTANGKSVVSRDYDFSTGSLNFGALPPGMLHPTSRPYLVELHPDKGYASIAMVAYDLLSGVLDGMNSEGLTVTLAMDDEQFESGAIEPTYGSATGLGVLQVLRLLLDTCATVEEAKETLLMTKQYYEYVPVHYLIADRFGKSFVWEYSSLHNKEFIIENPGEPLVLTNFTLNKHMDGEKPPSPELAKAECRRYAFLADRLNQGGVIGEDVLMATHKKVDAVGHETKRPPIRTFWHALYYPEERRARFSYYLRDEPAGIARTDYLEFRLSGTTAAATVEPKPPAEAAGATPKTKGVVNLNGVADGAAQLRAITDLAAVQQLGLKATDVTDADLAILEKMTNLTSLGLAETKITDDGLKHLAKLKKLEILNLSGTNITDAGLAHLAGLTNITGLQLSSTKITDAGLVHLNGMGRLTKLNVTNTAVTDAGAAAAKKSLPFWATIKR